MGTVTAGIDFLSEEYAGGKNDAQISKISLSNLPGAGSLPDYNANLGFSSYVPSKWISLQQNYYTGSAPRVDNKTFSISILGSRSIAEPDSIYTGIVNSRCADGLETTEAENANDIILTYSPPAPPTVKYDLTLPDAPEFSIDAEDLPENDTNISIINQIPEIFTFLDESVNILFDNILANVSTTAAEQLIERIYKASPGFSLIMRGIKGSITQLASNEDRQKARDKTTFSRDLLLIERRANLSTVMEQERATLNNLTYQRHSDFEQARIDSAKLSVAISMKNIAVAMIMHNAEVDRAMLAYSEYDAIVKNEVKKLDLYGKEMQAMGKAIDGNSDLAKAYKKQLGVVEQVFKTMEQAMQLSQLVVKLTGAQIEVETLNIKTQTMQIQGAADQAENDAFQMGTQSRAYGINDEIQLAVDRANMEVDKIGIENSILATDNSTKSVMMNAENAGLATLTASVQQKITSIQSTYNVKAMRAYYDSYISFSKSHHRAGLSKDESQARADKYFTQVQGRITADAYKWDVNKARTRADTTIQNGLEQYNRYEDEAARILHEAKMQMTLLQTISS